MASLDDHLLVFTDVDGTLLDNHTGEWQAAAGWLTRLREKSVPVILCSSQTAAEMIAMQKQLQLQGLPFIAENGAVIQLAAQWQDNEDFPRIKSDSTHADVASVLTRLRQQYGWKFTAFSELDKHVLAELTGLPLAQVSLALLQEASETLIWRDSDAALATFSETLAQLGLRFVQGARFWHVLDEQSGKDKAVNWLTRQYRHYLGQRAFTLGLGDGPNDAPLLDSVDYAIVVKGLNRQGVQLRRDTPNRVYYTQQEGAAGWREGMDHFFAHPSDAHT